MAVVDTAVKNAPAGTENAVALVKSAVAAANNAFESVQKAAKQATEVAEANFQAVTSTAVKASQAAAKAASAPPDRHSARGTFQPHDSTRCPGLSPGLSRVEGCLLGTDALSVPSGPVSHRAVFFVRDFSGYRGDAGPQFGQSGAAPPRGRPRWRAAGAEVGTRHPGERRAQDDIGVAQFEDG